MGGKKKAGGGKKGKGKGDDDGEIDQSQMNELLVAKVQALKARLVLEQERRDASEAVVEGIREEALDMDTKKETDKERTQTIVQKMTTIYKTMAEKYNDKIREHEKTVDEQEQQKKQLKEQIATLMTEKEEMITKYEMNILKLKERIDTMSTDFALMLKSTYKKMQERIDDANQTYEADHPGMGEGGGYGGAAGNSFGEEGAAPGI